jgi:ABC-type nitrate/sulfonate/bicarbonate transport system substrate-binding protein
MPRAAQEFLMAREAVMAGSVGHRVRIAPMYPSAMLAALQTKAIDGYATSLPFTTEAVGTGKAVMLASAVRDATDLLPFSYGLVYTRPDTCSRQREKCARLARALAGANALINDQPAAALDLLRLGERPEFAATVGCINQ